MFTAKLLKPVTSDDDILNENTIRNLEASTNTTIKDLKEDSKIIISGDHRDNVNEARKQINDLLYPKHTSDQIFKGKRWGKSVKPTNNDIPNNKKIFLEVQLDCKIAQTLKLSYKHVLDFISKDTRVNFLLGSNSDAIIFEGLNKEDLEDAKDRLLNQCLFLNNVNFDDNRTLTMLSGKCEVRSRKFKKLNFERTPDSSTLIFCSNDVKEVNFKYVKNDGENVSDVLYRTLNSFKVFSFEGSLCIKVGKVHLDSAGPVLLTDDGTLYSKTKSKFVHRIPKIASVSDLILKSLGENYNVVLISETQQFEIFAEVPHRIIQEIPIQCKAENICVISIVVSYNKKEDSFTCIKVSLHQDNLLSVNYICISKFFDYSLCLEYEKIICVDDKFGLNYLINSFVSGLKIKKDFEGKIVDECLEFKSTENLKVIRVHRRNVKRIKLGEYFNGTSELIISEITETWCNELLSGDCFDTVKIVNNDWDEQLKTNGLLKLGESALWNVFDESGAAGQGLLGNKGIKFNSWFERVVEFINSLNEGFSIKQK